MDAKWESIRALNLDGVKAKFAAKKGRWWQFWNSADRIEQQYRQFLYLIATNPGETVVPWSQDLDDFWHQHILSTGQYAKDCQAVFGQFIHHNPQLPEARPRTPRRSPPRRRCTAPPSRRRLRRSVPRRTAASDAGRT